MTKTHRARSRIFYGWYVLAACCLIYFLTTGSIYYGIAVVLKPMIETMGWTRAQGTAGVTVISLSMGLLGPLVAYLIDRIEVRNTMLIGAAAVAVGAATVYFTTSLAQYYLGLAFLGFGAAAQTFICSGQLVSRWFKRRRSLAMGLLLSAAGMGAFVITPVFGLIVARTGSWQIVFLLIGLTAPLCALLCRLVIRNDPAAVGESPDGGHAQDEDPATGARPTAATARVYQADRNWEVGEALRTPELWIVVGVIGVALLGLSLVSSQAVLHLTDLGIDAVIAGAAVGLVGLASLAGRLGSGFFGDRYEPKFLSAFGLVCVGLGVMILLYASRPALVYGFALVFGLGFGLSIVGGPLMVANYFGAGSFARINAVTGVITVGIGGFGPLLAGYASDKLGTYALVFGGFAVLACLLAIAVSLLRPPGVTR